MYKYLFLLLFTLVSLSACEKESPSVSWGKKTIPPTPQPDVPTPQPTPDPDVPTPKPDVPSPKPGMREADARVAARVEIPAFTTSADELFVVHRTAPSAPGRDSIVNYSVSYDRAMFHSRWVAFRFDAETRPKKVTRKAYGHRPQYPIDPLLPRAVALPSDFPFKGYDHGHLCASADRLYSREANNQTFYMSNMSPQIGQFNQRYWITLEQLVQDWGRDVSFADTLYVVKGGTIDKPNGILRYIPSGNVPVPAHYFMALLKIKNGVYSSIGFWMEHKNYGHKGTSAAMAKHAVSIHELERLTGIDFFHNLPDAVEQRTEATFSTAAWKL